MSGTSGDLGAEYRKEIVARLEASDWHGAYTWAKGWIGDGRDTCRLSGGSVDCGSPHARPSLHHYFDIDLDVLCSTIVVDLPALLGVVPRPVAET